MSSSEPRLARAVTITQLVVGCLTVVSIVVSAVGLQYLKLHDLDIRQANFERAVETRLAACERSNDKIVEISYQVAGITARVDTLLERVRGMK